MTYKLINAENVQLETMTAEDIAHATPALLSAVHRTMVAEEGNDCTINVHVPVPAGDGLWFISASAVRGSEIELTGFIVKRES